MLIYVSKLPLEFIESPFPHLQNLRVLVLENASIEFTAYFAFVKFLQMFRLWLQSVVQSQRNQRVYDLSRRYMLKPESITQNVYTKAFLGNIGYTVFLKNPEDIRFIPLYTLHYPSNCKAIKSQNKKETCFLTQQFI